MYPSFDLFVYYTYWRLSTKSDSKRTSSSLEGDTPEGFAFPSLRPQVFHPESERSYPTVEQQIHLLEYYQRYTRAWVRRQLVRSNPRNRDEAIRLLQSITQHIELRIRQAYRLDLETEQRLRSTLAQQRNIVVTSLTVHGDKGRQEKAGIHEVKHEAVHVGSVWGVGLISEI